MNRQAKRMMARQKTTAPDRVEAMRQRRAVTTTDRKRRGSVRKFLREVMQELKKVAWPGRQEMVAYTIVVVIAVVFLTALVFGMDFVFTKGVLHFFGKG